MQQEDFSIPLSAGKRMYGTLNTAENDAAILFVHGLTGHIDEHHFYNAANQFPQQGYDTIRISLYSDEDDARKLHECTITTHAADVDAAINAFRPKYKKLYLVGHSLGAPSILFSKQKNNADAIVLWDPSIALDPQEDKKFFIYDERIDEYRMEFGVTSLMSVAMHEEWKTLDQEAELKSLKIPTKFIFTPWMWNHGGEERVRHAQRSEHIILDTNHTFTTLGAEKRLFEETLNFLKQH